MAHGHTRIRLTRMRFGDLVALMVVALLVGLSISAELRDVILSEIIAEEGASEDTPPWIIGSLFVLHAGRQFALLPLVILCVPWLVLVRGSDSLNTCFNGVAVLFVLDMVMTSNLLVVCRCLVVCASCVFDF